MAPMMASGVACILATRDRPGFAAEAARSLHEALRPQDEGVVVDSGSLDPGAIRAAVEGTGLEVVRAEVPGASLARNVGAAATTAPLLAFTDDDCLPADDWTEEIDRAFADPRIGFVTGRVVPDRAEGMSVSVLGDETPRRFGREADPFDLGHGANMAVRRVAFEGIGGFDHALGAGAPLRSSEDKDVFLRVLDAGWEGAYDPRVVVVHRQWRSAPAVLRLSLSYGLGAGALAAKVARTGGGTGTLRRVMWERGIGEVAEEVRKGHERWALAACAKAVGGAIGAVLGAAWPLEGGRFRA